MGFSLDNGFNTNFLEKLASNAALVRKLQSAIETFTDSITTRDIEAIVMEGIDADIGTHYLNLETFYEEMPHDNGAAEIAFDGAMEYYIEKLETIIRKFVPSAPDIKDLHYWANTSLPNLEKFDSYIEDHHVDDLQEISMELVDGLSDVLKAYKKASKIITQHVDLFNGYLGRAAQRHPDMLVPIANLVEGDIINWFTLDKRQEMQFGGVNLFPLDETLVILSNYYDTDFQWIAEHEEDDSNEFVERAEEYYGFIVGSLVDWITAAKKLKNKLES